MQRAKLSLLMLLGCAFAAACQCEPDVVQPGYYGVEAAGSAAPSRVTAPGAPVIGSAGSTPSAQAGAAPAQPNVMMSGTAGSGGSSGTPAGTAGTAGTAGASGGPTKAGGSAPATGSACDLGGPWLMTQHSVADGLGQLQTIHTWLYLEIEQQGDAFSVSRGLNCGDDVVARTALGGNADFHNAWTAMMRKVVQAGRKGTSAVAGAECKIQFDKWYTLKGVTTPHYLDPTIALPTIEQKANGSTPGWEDWDEDGQPGVTGAISGLLVGKIFIANRTWNQLSGTAAITGASFKLAMQWAEETNVLAYDGSPLLETQAVRAADASLHFAELARLTPGQASGDDLAICAAVRKLAPMLTPEAAGM